MEVVIKTIESKKQLVPLIRFKGCNYDWLKVDLRTVVKVNQGLAILRSKRFETNGPNRFKYITVPYLLGGKCHFIEKPQESVKCEEEDVIVTRTGSGVGQIWTGVSGVFHNNFFKVLPIENRVRKDFIYQYLLSPFIQSKMKSFAGSSAIPDLNHSEFYLLPFYLPTPIEQQKIASFLSAVDTKIQQLTKKKELLRKYKKGVMQQLFKSPLERGHRGVLRFKDENGAEFPEWEVKKLGDIGKIKMCKRVFSNQTTETGDIPFYKIGTFGKEANSYISMELFLDLKEKYSYPKVGEILLSASGTLGRTVVYDGSEAYFQDSNIVWIENNEELITNEFLFYVYQVVRYQSEGGTIQRLYNSIISSARFLKPSLLEQYKVVRFLSSLDTKIALVNTQIEKTQCFKKGLLQQLFV